MSNKEESEEEYYIRKATQLGMSVTNLLEATKDESIEVREKIYELIGLEFWS